jgi:hypothetical protein
VVIHDFIQRFGATVLRKIIRGSGQYPTIILCDRQRDIAAVIQHAVANRNIDRIAKDIAYLIGKRQAQRNFRVLLAKTGDQRQQNIAANVRRNGNTQLAADLIIAAVQALSARLHHFQHLLGEGQIFFSFSSQTQAARRAHKQALIQIALQPVDGGADLTR